MPKSPSFKTSFSSLIDKIKKGQVQNNYLLFCSQKVLFDDFIATLGDKFAGKDFNLKDNYRIYFSDEDDILNVLNECSNIGFFVEKKIVMLKLIKKSGVKGLKIADKKSLMDYYNNFNPDTILILNDANEDYNPDNYADLINPNLAIYDVNEFSETAYKNWIKYRFDDYEISDNEIEYLMQFMNMSYDEMNQEIEKLKIYCMESKKITKEDINLCVGVTKDFSETALIKSVLEKDSEKALQIYESLILKKDVEIFLLILLNSAFISIAKLTDPQTRQLSGFPLKRALKLWYDSDELLPVYKSYLSQINEIQLNKAFSYIYSVEKAFKSSDTDKNLTFSKLIIDLCNL
ncbi:MAG TPA: DNA polymerase III subunit delta [Ignavibacteria bacterium]|nr:DNA polymerase III subunit delta [Ignavibacteria bacterium]